MTEDAPRLASATAADLLGGAWQVDELRRDGSDRRYVRLRHPDGQTVMAMVWPANRTAGEAGAKSDPASTFVQTTRELSEAGLPVPRLLGYRPDLRVLLLEDLGRTHLADLFDAGQAPVEQYRAALVQLHRFQQAGFPGDSPICSRSYDENLWYWEFDHFRDWGVERRAGQGLSADVARRVDDAFRALSARLAAAPRVPVHRDYHSRNLMIDPKGDLRWIDYQDALLGHPFYDVASLLWDAYVELDDAIRTALFTEWLADAPPRIRSAFADPEAELALVAIQRMLKAAGRFVLFVQEKGIEGFDAYIPGLLHRVEHLATVYQDRLPLYHDIIAPLRCAVPEWQR